MKIISLVALAMLAVAAAPMVSAETTTVTRAWQFKPASSAGLEIRNLIGDVRVESGGEGFHVTAQVSVDAATPAEAERLARAVEFRSKDAGGRSIFHVAFPKEAFPKIYHPRGTRDWWQGAAWVEYLGEKRRLSADPEEAPPVSVSLVVRAPAGASLKVYNQFGDAQAQGHVGSLLLDGGQGRLRSAGGQGRLVLDSGSGPVEVAGHQGEVLADTGSGDIVISDCRCDIVIDTGSGSTRISGSAGSLDADTGSGAVRLDGYAGPIRADTGSGRIEARRVSGLDRLDIDSGSGSVDIEGDLSALRNVSIDTGSGSVALRSSATPSLQLRIETGAGGVTVDAPGSTIERHDDVWSVRFGGGEGRGTIETGAGSVEFRVEAPSGD